MEAVCKGELPDNPSFDGNELHWWKTTYFQAASFEMGDPDFNIMIALMNEAETSGLIVNGSAQDLFCARELKKQLRKDIYMLTSAIEHLFHHQIESDVRVCNLIHRQYKYQSLADERMRYLYFKQQAIDASMRKVIWTQETHLSR